MVNPKRKPEEATKRSPGKSKFVFPKKDAPPVDNAYFDRLFSELKQQPQEPGARVTAGELPAPLESALSEVVERSSDRTTLGVGQSTSLPPGVAASSIPINESVGESSSQPKTFGLEEAGIVSETPGSIQHSSFGTIPQPGSAESLQREDYPQLCKPETSGYVDRLKLTYRLSKGEANVLRYLLGASHDQDNTDCYVTIPKLAALAGLTPRGCQLTLKSLQTRGFVVRIEEYDPSNRRGIRLRMNLISL